MTKWNLEAASKYLLLLLSFAFDDGRGGISGMEYISGGDIRCLIEGRGDRTRDRTI